MLDSRTSTADQHTCDNRLARMKDTALRSSRALEEAQGVKASPAVHIFSEKALKKYGLRPLPFFQGSAQPKGVKGRGRPADSPLTSFG